MDLEHRIQELEENKGRNPRTAIQRVCAAIEVFLREALDLEHGASLAVLQEEFRKCYPDEKQLYYKIVTLRELRNVITFTSRQPWPGDEEIAIGILKNFAHLDSSGTASGIPATEGVISAADEDARQAGGGTEKPKLRLVSANRQAVPEPDSRRFEAADFERLVEYHFGDLFAKTFSRQVPYLSDGSSYQFDLISTDREVVIDCLSPAWNQSGEFPLSLDSAALWATDWLKRCTADRRLLVLQDDVLRRASLAAVFVHRNHKDLEGIQVWVYAKGLFWKLSP
ncbi:MAG TPA: hypothetical protein VGK99_11895 [Acidobacteriota bacterium]|jgi:hypothetical protein